MKGFILAVALALVAVSVKGQTCDPIKDCIFSDECATSGGDLSCRCNYLKCKDYGEVGCGGGCVSDDQCSQWGGAGCVCSWLSCEKESRTKEPGYETYAKLMAIISRDKLAQKLPTLTEEQKAYYHLLDKKIKEN